MLRGPSGGGKTTLLNILGTIDLASSGEIGILLIFPYSSAVMRLEILGESVNEKSSDAYLADLRLRKIGKCNA